MSTMAKLVMKRFYREAAGDPACLPWHRESPSRLLVSAVEALGKRGRALDVGAGAGVFSVWMAEQEMTVTSLDLFPEAIAMTRARMAAHGVKLDVVQGDLASYRPEAPFDLVFDSGCLHSLIGSSPAEYKRLLLGWLAPGGHFVLEHWGKRHLFDWRPMGPRRRSEATITHLFAPELTLRTSEADDFDAPLPFGPKVRGVAYHFERVRG